jgi:multicomponent K+:H+ antiporter subunit E
MTRWLPFPLMSAFLLVAWLLLNQSLSAGHVVLGCILAITGGWLLGAVEAPHGRIRRPVAAVRLASRVLLDIVRSNIAVARFILNLAPHPPASGFVRIPLDIRHPYGLAALACIITATPGTIWVDFDSADTTLTIHVLDLVDEDEWIRTIKNRYERLLREIFE